MQNLEFFLLLIKAGLIKEKDTKYWLISFWILTFILWRWHPSCITCQVGFLALPRLIRQRRQAPPIDFDDDNESDSEIVIVDGLSKTHMTDGKKLTLPQTVDKASDNDHAPPQFPELQPQSSTPDRIQAKMPLQGNDFWPQTTHDLTEPQMMGPCSKDTRTFSINDQNLTLPTGPLRPHVQGSTSINGQMHTLTTDSLRPHVQGSTLINGQIHNQPTDPLRPHTPGSTLTNGPTQTLPIDSLRSHAQGPQDIQATDQRPNPQSLHWILSTTSSRFNPRLWWPD